jgi:O-antigen ligase
MNSARESRFLAFTTAALVVVLVARFFDIFPGLAGVPAVRILTVFAILAFVLSPRRERAGFGSAAVARLFIWFVALSVGSVAFSIWRGASFGMVIGPIAALAVMFALIFKVGHSLDDLKRMLLALALSAAILVGKGFFGGGEVAGRLLVMGAYDPNDLAFVLIAVLPVVLAFWRSATGVARLWWFALAGASLWTVLLTQSRGGFIGLALALAYLAAVGAWRRNLQSGVRPSQVFAGAILLAALAVPSWVLLPDDARERFSTILNPTEDYNYTAQREGRIPVWKRGLETLSERPWGTGVGTYSIAEMRKSGYWRTAHNSQLQIAVELGVVGWLLYVALFVQSWRVLGRIVEAPTPASDADPTPYWRIHAQHLKASLLGVLGAGFFLSMGYATVVFALFAVIAALEARFVPRAALRKATLGRGAAPLGAPDMPTVPGAAVPSTQHDSARTASP